MKIIDTLIKWWHSLCPPRPKGPCKYCGKLTTERNVLASHLSGLDEYRHLSCYMGYSLAIPMQQILKAGSPPQPATPPAVEIEHAQCTLCAKNPCSGFFHGCLLRDMPPAALYVMGVSEENKWTCDGSGNLTRPAKKHEDQALFGIAIFKPGASYNKRKELRLKFHTREAAKEAAGNLWRKGNLAHRGMVTTHPDMPDEPFQPNDQTKS